jgi:hypothetical protein
VKGDKHGEMEERIAFETLNAAMALEEDVMLQFREDACFTIYAVCCTLLMLLLSKYRTLLDFVSQICPMPDSLVT